MLYPKGLDRYQGKGQKVVFDQMMQIECSQIFEFAGHSIGRLRLFLECNFSRRF